MKKPSSKLQQMIKGILLLLGAASLATLTASCGSGSYPTETPDLRLDGLMGGQAIPGVSVPLK